MLVLLQVEPLPHYILALHLAAPHQRKIKTLKIEVLGLGGNVWKYL